VRSLVVYLLGACLIGCGDKPPTSVAPTPGSVAVPIDAGVVPVDAESLRFALRPLSGKPPNKTTQPVTRELLTKLSALDMTQFGARVTKLDDSFLQVEYGRTLPPLLVTVTIQDCLRCLPMELARWRAETDALRIVIPPDLRDRADTLFELTQLSLGGAPVIATYHLAFAGDTGSHAVTVYHTDGINQIRVTAAYAGVAETRDALAGVTRRELEVVALAALDLYAQAW
jgi:hypothetical protein